MAYTNVDIIESLNDIFLVSPAIRVGGKLSYSDLKVLCLLVPSHIVGDVVEFNPRFDS